eukprot:420410_1
MSSMLMMNDMSAGQTIVAAEGQSIRLPFEWGKSCFKGKYPRWKQLAVTDLLHNNGLTDEMLRHELKLLNDQVNTYYGNCMKCYVLFYIIILLCSLGAIACQFVFPQYRQNIFNLINEKSFLPINNTFFDIIYLCGGIVGIILFLILMLIHRKACSNYKYKITMSELKDYIYGFELQNKYQLVKWVVKHTIDGVQFDIIITPLQRENQLLKKPDVAMSTVSI